jgi:hypothetical protein
MPPWRFNITSMARKFTFTSIATTARRATTVNDRHRVNGPFHGSIPSFLAQRSKGQSRTITASCSPGRQSTALRPLRWPACAHSGGGFTWQLHVTHLHLLLDSSPWMMESSHDVVTACMLTCMLSRRRCITSRGNQRHRAGVLTRTFLVSHSERACIILNMVEVAVLGAVVGLQSGKGSFLRANQLRADQLKRGERRWCSWYRCSLRRSDESRQTTFGGMMWSEVGRGDVV